MFEIGTILGIIAIILTIALSDPAIRFFGRLKEERKREKWSADLQVDEAMIQELKHYAYEFWQQEIEVDSDGNADHRVEARIINIGDRLLERVTFPVYCDAKGIPASDVRPWAACGRTTLPAQVEDWIFERARGRVAIAIVPPLAPGERRKIRWGYRLPKTFAPGDDYYNWDIATPHYEIGGKIVFSDTWVVQYVRWESNLTATQSTLSVKNRTIRWTMRFPERGKRITLRFGLTKKN